MTLSCREVTQRFVAELDSGFHCESLDGKLRIVTPYPFPDNDLIEVFVEELSSERVRVTDLGETLRFLFNEGLDTGETRKRRETASNIAAGSGVELIRGQLVKEGDVGDVGTLMFDVIVAARGVSDLLLTARTYEPATFREEVGNFLAERGEEYEPDARLLGSSGKIYRVHFRLPGRNRYLETLSPRLAGGMQAVINRVFRIWVDANGNLSRGSKISVLNDVDFAWKQPEIALLSGVSVVGLWSRPDKLWEYVSANGQPIREPRS
ncbi:MAG: DUF1828 domain-containing protein [Dehalococcoidia bacterium]